MRRVITERFPISVMIFHRIVEANPEFPPGFPGAWERDPYMAPAPIRSLSRAVYFPDVSGANFNGSIWVEGVSRDSIQVTVSVSSSENGSFDLLDDDYEGDTIKLDELTDLVGDRGLAWEIFDGPDESEESLVWADTKNMRGSVKTISRLGKTVMDAVRAGLEAHLD